MNGFLTNEQINIIEGIIGYTFKNKDLLSIAFRRSSFTEEVRISGINLPSNETLEFYGDSVLNLIVVRANAKLAAKLCDIKLDIKPYSALMEETQGEANE